MSKPSTQHALTVLASTELVAKDNELELLKTAAVDQFAAVAKMEGRAARGGIVCGLTLHRLKSSLPHGKFLPFVDQMFPEGTFQSPVTRRKNVSYLMRLAEVFIEKAKVSKPDILALPGDPLSLELGDNHTAQRFLEKLDKFAGEASLNELLIKHGIKGVGLKKALEAAKAKEEGEPAAPDAEQLYLQYRDEAGGVIQRAESLFLQEGCLAHLIGHPEELQGIANGLRSLADKVETQVKDLLSQQPEASDQTPESDAATLAEIS